MFPSSSHLFSQTPKLPFENIYDASIKSLQSYDEMQKTSQRLKSILSNLRLEIKALTEKSEKITHTDLQNLSGKIKQSTQKMADAKIDFIRCKKLTQKAQFFMNNTHFSKKEPKKTTREEIQSHTHLTLLSKTILPMIRKEAQDEIYLLQKDVSLLEIDYKNLLSTLEKDRQISTIFQHTFKKIPLVSQKQHEERTQSLQRLEKTIQDHVQRKDPLDTLLKTQKSLAQFYEKTKSSASLSDEDLSALKQIDQEIQAIEKALGKTPSAMQGC